MPTPRNNYGSESTVTEVTGYGVAWPAIIGGALAMLAISLILTPLGAGLGLAWLSSWHHTVPSVRTFTVMNVIWLLVAQWLASGLGGYLTGRLRTKWVGAHTHEVFFRDTVHGFLAWALAAVISAALLLAATVAGGSTEGPGISATGSLLYSLSLFLGAFIASAAGALGGRDRDVHYQTGRFEL